MSSIAIRLNNMLPGTRMIVFADHGFRQDPQFAIYDKYSRSRYVHGGCSPFEVIVPMVVLEKI
jgi:hypothetical protein